MNVHGKLQNVHCANQEININLLRALHISITTSTDKAIVIGFVCRNTEQSTPVNNLSSAEHCMWCVWNQSYNMLPRWNKCIKITNYYYFQLFSVDIHLCGGSSQNKLGVLCSEAIMLLLIHSSVPLAQKITMLNGVIGSQCVIVNSHKLVGVSTQNNIKCSSLKY